jgi:predicted Zn-dependent protease
MLLVVLGTASTGCVTTGTNPVSGNQRAYGYSWEEEVRLGTNADRQIQEQYGVYEDDRLQQYVDEVSRKVLATSHMRRADTDAKFRNTEFAFRVLDSPVINAFALPGGYVYVTRGLMAHLNNEAQLAVVLGHEIGHVAARHASQQAARQQFTQGLLLGGAVVGGAALGGQAAENILGIGGQAAQLLSLSYSRDNERESDRLGVEYATMAGYEAAEGAAFFETLKRIRQQSGQSVPTWQSTHPDPGAREQTIPQLAAEWQRKADRSSYATNQDAYYDAIGGIVLGENPRNGFVDDEVYYHPEKEYRFPLPSGWDVQAQRGQVAMVHPQQEAYVVFSESDASSLNEAATAFAGQEGATFIDQSEITVNGLEARRVVIEGQTQQGQRLRVLGVFVQHRGAVYDFRGLTTAERYATFRDDFEGTMRGFARLTDPDVLNVQPTRLKVRPAPRTAAFRTFVDGEALPRGMMPEDLAIINQVSLDTQIEAGRPLKLPRE